MADELDCARTVAEAFAASAALHKDRDFLQVLSETAVALGVEARTWTYSQAAVEIDRLRGRYAAQGYGHGHRAGLLLLNRPEFIFHWFALNGLGVSVVPINPDWRSAELEYLVDHSEICVAACIPSRAADLLAAATVTGRPLVITDPAGQDIGAATLPTPDGNRAPDENTECALLYTSGTTGRPKGCILPNEYFLQLGRWYSSVGGLCAFRLGSERMLTPLPLTHMNAMAASTMSMVLTGGCLIFLDRFHPRSWWDSVRTARATIVHYLGIMPAILLSAPVSPDDRRHEVRFGFGAGVSPRHQAGFEERFGFPLTESWGMTEGGAGATVIANREPRFVGSSCFGAMDMTTMDCRIVDESGADVQAGVPGELLVRRTGSAPRFGFFRGYLKDPVATTEAWAGGWFHTGDLVTRDAAGYFRFVDRKKNLIRRSGENISAVEVESVLGQHPAVRTVGVAPVPDELRGDEVFACIILRDASTASADLARQICQFCLERLAYFKAPGYISFCTTLPLTPTEKIQRLGLKNLCKALFEQHSFTDLRPMKRRLNP
jgi:acyl-CoA synthetase (AMP-forming)/AMP-acid ligase II